MVTLRAVAGGIKEGDYTSWTWKWSNVFSNGLYSQYQFDTHIDEENEVINLSWMDSSGHSRFGIYNLSNFSTIYESPAGSDYAWSAPYIEHKEFFTLGNAYFHNGAISRAIQTYILLLRSDEDIIEVWRGGASPLWSTNTQTDFGAASVCTSGEISLIGKYILVRIKEGGSPWDSYLMLYEGT